MNVSGEVVEEGGITVSAKILSDIVRELPPESIKLATTANDRVEITCGEGVYKIIGLPDDEFPDLPSIESDFFTMDGPLLCSTIHKTEFAAFNGRGGSVFSERNLFPPDTGADEGCCH